MSEHTVATRAYELLRSRNAAVGESVIPRLLTMIPAARRELALRVNRESRRDALRKNFALTVSSGAVDLSGASFLAASEPLLLETVKAAEIRSASSSYKWQWVVDALTLLDVPLR